MSDGVAQVGPRAPVAGLRFAERRRFPDSYLSSATDVLKRSFDVTLALLLIVLTAPLIILAVLAIRCESPGPALFRQRRIGRRGREFTMLKLRSMADDAERATGPVWARVRDPRVTRIGATLRKLRIDELPQLFNVLGGEMSLVGPRPERACFVEQLQREAPHYRLRHVVRPGITGWAQVRMGYAATPADGLRKLEFDLYYVENYSLLLDIWILLQTTRVVLTGAGAR